MYQAYVRNCPTILTHYSKLIVNSIRYVRYDVSAHFNHQHVFRISEVIFTKFGSLEARLATANNHRVLMTGHEYSKIIDCDQASLDLQSIHGAVNVFKFYFLFCNHC